MLCILTTLNEINNPTLYARAKTAGLPRKTALAPKARALRTSVPSLTPPSRYTSHLPPTACTTSGNTSICDFKACEVGHISSVIIPLFTADEAFVTDIQCPLIYTNDLNSVKL